MSSNPDPQPSGQQARASALAMTEEEREAYYIQRVQQQRAELTHLVQEREKLLKMQQELQMLHDSMPGQSSPPQQPMVRVLRFLVLNALPVGLF